MPVTPSRSDQDSPPARAQFVDPAFIGGPRWACPETPAIRGSSETRVRSGAPARLGRCHRRRSPDRGPRDRRERPGSSHPHSVYSLDGFAEGWTTGRIVAPGSVVPAPVMKHTRVVAAKRRASCAAPTSRCWVAVTVHRQACTNESLLIAVAAWLNGHQQVDHAQPGRTQRR